MKGWKKDLCIEVACSLVFGAVIWAIFTMTGTRPAAAPLSVPSMPGPVVDGLQLSYLRDDNAGKCFAYFKGHPESLIETACAGVRW
jgi:hypothetical protein